MLVCEYDWRRQVLLATKILGAPLPKLFPTMVSKFPPVRVQFFTEAAGDTVPQPATPVMLGRAYESARSSNFVELPDCTVRVNCNPDPSGKENRNDVRFWSTAFSSTGTGSPPPSVTLKGGNKLKPTTVMTMPPAHGHTVVLTRTSEESGPAGPQPDREYTTGVYWYVYVSTDGATTRDVVSHN